MKHINTLLLFLLATTTSMLFGQAGTLDNTFSADGLISIEVVPSAFDQGRAVVINDGKITVVGTTGYSKAYNFGAARFLSDGTPDPDFSFDGVTSTPVVPGDDQARAVAVQADGKTVIGGYGLCSEGNCFAMVRYLANGLPDPSFGNGSIVTTEFSGGYTLEASAIAVQDDGKILLAGGGIAGFAIVRYFEDGTIDTDFGTDGLATCAFSQGNDRANGMVVLPDGKILVSGYASGIVSDSIAVTRFNTDGTVDTDFGAGGRARASLFNQHTIGQALAVGPDGEIVVAGYYVPAFAVEPAALVVRFTAEGELDTSFNGTGLRDLAVAGSDASQLNGVAVQPDGKVVACGFVTLATNDFMVVRLNADGSDDVTFNTTGLVTTDFTGTTDRAHAVALQDDGRIVVVGETNAGIQDNNFAVARYLGDANVGVEEAMQADGSMQVYPQPFSGNATLTFLLPKEDVISVDLHDAHGAFVQQVINAQRRSAGTHQMPLRLGADLPAGIYVLTLRGQKMMRALKLAVE